MIVAASAGAQSVPTVMPDGSILIDGVYYYPNGTNPVSSSGSGGSGPIVIPPPTCTYEQVGCVTISTGTGNDTVTPSSGNGTVGTGTVRDVISPQTGGFVTGAPAVASASDVPEPASWGMMMLGFAFVGGALRRQRRRAPALST